MSSTDAAPEEGPVSQTAVAGEAAGATAVPDTNAPGVAGEGSSVETVHGAEQTAASPSEDTLSPASPTSPPAEANGETRGMVVHPKSSERHVAFNPDIQVAGIVFHKEKTQKELEAELDVFGRLYRKTTPAKPSAPEPGPTEPTAVTEVANVAADGSGPPEGEGSTPAVVKPRAAAAATSEAPSNVKVDPKLEKELAECTFKPSITQVAQAHRKLRNFDEFVKLQSEWVVQQRRKKDEALRRQNFDEGIGQPLYDDMKRPHSKKIIEFLEKQHLYKSPQQTYKEHAALKQRHQQVGGSQRSGSSGTNPMGNYQRESHHHRRTAHVDPALFDRLYHEATIREAALRVMEQTQIEKEARELFRPTTNESYWRSSTMLGARTPSRNRSSGFPDDDDDNEYYYDDDAGGSSGGGGGFGLEFSVEEDLIAKGEEYKRRREERMRRNESEREVCTFKPVMDANSRRILLRKALEQEMDRDEAQWFDNDERIIHASHGGGGGAANVEGSPQRRHEERLSLDGDEIANLEQKNKVRFDAEVFTARMQRRDIDRAQKIASLRRAIKLEEVAECTFRPSISKKSNDSVQRHRPTSHSGSMGGTPKSGAGGMHTRGASNVESYSPDYGRRAPSNPTVPAPVASDERRQRQQVANRGKQPVHHHRAAQQAADEDAMQDGDAYLQHLEDDLRGVIAEWTTISTGAVSPHAPPQRR